MAMEEPLRQSGWGRKPHSVVKWGVGAGSDIQELKKTMAALHTSANPKYLSCLSGGGGNERVKSRSEGNNNSFK